eukprot:4290588-Amphidinium_carterae.1
MFSGQLNSLNVLVVMASPNLGSYIYICFVSNIAQQLLKFAVYWKDSLCIVCADWQALMSLRATSVCLA